MDDKNFSLAEDIINPSYVRLGKNSINKRQKMMKQLLAQRQLPEEPLDDLTIKYFLDTFALMDSNNFDGKIGVGQRESRVFSNLVKERHFYMGHGIGNLLCNAGRSGDVVANQPKAAGSSLILQLTRYLVVSAFRELNYEFVNDVLVLPLATGMSISLGLLMLANKNPEKKYVIWSRIDQKTCLKAIETANLIPVVIELRKQGDSLVTDVDAIREKIKELGSDKILAILTTTSCFAPRVPDDVEEISILAKQSGVYHVVNNAYGIWCTKIANKLKQAFRKGQCTIVVQSTDKNFLVPVGGSILYAKNSQTLQKISSHYPGRASGAPILDLFITLLSMGKSTIRKLKKERKQNYQLMLQKGKQFSKKHSFSLLQTPHNSISIAMSLQPLLTLMESTQLTELGSILYSKRVMGHRVIVSKPSKTKICSIEFGNYGSHCEDYDKLPYITFACAVGTKLEEVEEFFGRLEEGVKELKKNVEKEKKKKALSDKISDHQKKEEKEVNATERQNAKIEAKFDSLDVLRSENQSEIQRNLQNLTTKSEEKPESEKNELL